MSARPLGGTSEFITVIPASTFRGVLKQVRTRELSAFEAEVVGKCLPEFLRNTPRESPLLHVGVRPASAFQPQPSEWGRLRRYAGSDDLTAGRYYSVCSNRDGDDGGTLKKELMSYWDESTGLLVELLDTSLLSDEQRQVLRHEPGQLKLGLKATRYEGGALSQARTGVCWLPLSIEEVEIPNVVDLRAPDVQAWFFELFFGLEQEIGLRGHRAPDGNRTVVVTLKYHQPRDFIDLVPTLVMPGIGGSTFHQAVGAWLRSHGVAGLVYPSARRDAFVKLRAEERPDGRVWRGEFSGWNFVDYRDSGPAEWDWLFGRLSTWVLMQKAGIEVRRFNGDVVGWEIIGAEDGERSRIELGRDILLGEVEAPPDWDPRGGYRRPYYKRSQDQRSAGWSPFSK